MEGFEVGYDGVESDLVVGREGREGRGKGVMRGKLGGMLRGWQDDGGLVMVDRGLVERLLGNCKFMGNCKGEFFT